MSSYEYTFSVPSLFEEKDYEILVEFSVTSWGSSASYWDPGDPLEWEIDSISIDGELIPYVYQKDRFYVSGEQQVKEALWQVLADAADHKINYNFDWSGAAMDDYLED